MGFLNKVIPRKYIETYILMIEIIILIYVILFLFVSYGYSKEYYIIGAVCLTVVFWRIWTYGD